MIDVFLAIHDCSDLVSCWDVARRGDGVVLHATSRLAFRTQEEAEKVGGEIATAVQPQGYDVEEIDVQTKQGEDRTSWHAFVEVSLS